ncbi:hypothetical protein E4U43_004397 [Claviceps pusilla]|uniref:DUF7514 domain-containing protein n=1 Tax=Claviceps pusilla TaxID=123648 RepID=A0A9P7N5L0_9HYPO|nr:hypothetical protein E4U43_004397 [Claviceps pusilla]
MPSHDDTLPCSRLQSPPPVKEHTRARTSRTSTTHTDSRPLVTRRRPKFQATVEEYDSDSSSAGSAPPASTKSAGAGVDSDSSSKEDRLRRGDTPARETPFLSIVDKQWGVLFTDEGEPTRRLGEVLRGVANYIIREYEPPSSLVIPPSKLSAFYRRYRLEKEPFPLDALFDFDSRHALRNLELLYQDLSCEYHLIPDSHHHRTRPSIPALTPRGLQTWLTLLIQASPSCESLRLSRLLLDVPLETDPSSSSPSSSSPSATPERLPAQLSRYLLPAHRNEKIYSAIVSALDAWYDRTRGITTTTTTKRVMPVSVSSPPSWSTILYDALGGGVSCSSSSSSSSTTSSVFSQHRKPKRLPQPQRPHPEKTHYQDMRPRAHETVVLPSGYSTAAVSTTTTNTRHPQLRQRSKCATLTFDDGPEETLPPRTRVSGGPGPRAGELRAQPAHDTGYDTDRRTHRVRVNGREGYSHHGDQRAESYRLFQGRVPFLTRDELLREKGNHRR